MLLPSKPVHIPPELLYTAGERVFVADLRHFRRIEIAQPVAMRMALFWPDKSNDLRRWQHWLEDFRQERPSKPLLTGCLCRLVARIEPNELGDVVLFPEPLADEHTAAGLVEFVEPVEPDRSMDDALPETAGSNPIVVIGLRPVGAFEEA